MLTGKQMNKSFEFIRGLAILLGAAIAVIAFIYWTCKKSEDPARMLFKWVLTIGVLVFMFRVVGPIVGGDNYAAAFVGVPLVPTDNVPVPLTASFVVEVALEL